MDELRQQLEAASKTTNQIYKDLRLYESEFFCCGVDSILL